MFGKCDTATCFSQAKAPEAERELNWTINADGRTAGRRLKAEAETFIKSAHLCVVQYFIILFRRLALSHRLIKNPLNFKSLLLNKLTQNIVSVHHFSINVCVVSRKWTEAGDLIICCWRICGYIVVLNARN